MDCAKDCTAQGCFFEKQIKFPSEERLRQKPVAVIECCQQIPCNPCQDYCPFGVITVAGNINAVPEIDFDNCTGCGLCLGYCPGLAIFLLHIDGERGLVTVPLEMEPPAEGEEVDLLNRAGEKVSEGVVAKVRKHKQHDRCFLVTLEMEKDLIKTVRGFRRRK
jgi:Fe-S-cluster-containing hydrogenase component 2